MYSNNFHDNFINFKSELFQNILRCVFPNSAPGCDFEPVWKRFRCLCIVCTVNFCTSATKAPHLLNHSKVVFSWLRNSEAILHVVTLPNCGLVSCALCCKGAEICCKQLNRFKQTASTTVAKPSMNCGTVWPDKEVKALIAIWCEGNVHKELDGAVRNQAIYQWITKQLRKQGYERDWKPCHAKIKNLKTVSTLIHSQQPSLPFSISSSSFSVQYSN